MNRRRRRAVHGSMNRADLYLKQLHAMQAWLSAQGDDEGAAIADELAERLNRDHEAVDVQDWPEWANSPDDAIDIEPDIRCHPDVGCVFEGDDGLYLTIDPMDGGDVKVVHMGDVVRWVERRGAPDPEQGRGRGVPETPSEAAERAAFEAAVGEDGVVDAEFEDDAPAGDENAGPYSAMHADEQLGAEGPDDIDLTGDADDGSEDSGEDDEGFV